MARIERKQFSIGNLDASRAHGIARSLNRIDRKLENIAAQILKESRIDASADDAIIYRLGGIGLHDASNDPLSVDPKCKLRYDCVVR